MNSFNKENFTKDLLELLDKYNVTLETCGCCGGVGVLDKDDWVAVMDFVRSEDLRKEVGKDDK